LEVPADDEFGVGAVLCFLPGWAEIKLLADRLEGSSDADNLWVLRLHSMVTRDEQQQIFEPAPEGKVKVILGTNIAESSVTINDVRVVVDAGLHREVSYDPKRRMSSLETVWICQSNAVQRKGRAGRVRAGRVFRLYSREQFESVPWRPAPEMQRCNLSQTCLQTIALGRDPREFLANAPDPPAVALVEAAMAELTAIDAIRDGVPPQMLPVGQVLCRMPLEPLLGRAMILGSLFGIPQMTAALLAVSSGRSPFLMPPDKRNQAKEARKEYCPWSDTVASLRALMEFERIYQERGEYAAKSWSEYFFINFQRMMGFSRIKFQLLLDVQRSGLLGAADSEGMDPEEWVGEAEDWEGGGFPDTSESDGAIFEAQEGGVGMEKREWLEELRTSDREVEDERLLIGILCAAYPTNIAVREQSSHKKHKTPSGAMAIIDPRSVNSNIRSSQDEQESATLPSPSWWVYSTLRMHNSQLNMQDTTLVSGWHVALFGGLRAREEPSLELDGWIGVQGNSDEANSLVVHLREEIRQALIWVAIATSWDRVAQAATSRSKALFRVLAKSLVLQKPAEEDLQYLRDWQLPELEEGAATLQAAEEEEREEVEERLWKKTVVELKVLLREMNAKVSGRKAELVERCADCLMYGSEDSGEAVEEFKEELSFA